MASAQVAKVGWRVKVNPLPSSTLDVHKYGDNNLLPNEIMEMVYDSGTASACYSKLAQFLYAKGFVNEAASKLQVNEHQTANALLAELVPYRALLRGTAYAVNFSILGTEKEVACIPFECVRKLKNGRFVVNFGLSEGKQKKEDDMEFLPFNPYATPEEISQEIIDYIDAGNVYYGHMYYSFRKRPGQNIYPIPDYFAGKEDIETDAEISRFERKNIKNGFFPDAMLTAIGEEYDDVVVRNDDGTETSAPSDAKTGLVKTIKSIKGGETEATVLLITAPNKESVPDLKTFDRGPGLKSMEGMTDRVANKVARHFGVPPVLIGLSTEGKLGNNQELLNSIKLFGLVLAPMQDDIKRDFEVLFPGHDWSISSLNPFDYIDPVIAAKMTDDEIRSFGGLPELEKPQSSEMEKTLAALNSLSPLVANKVLESLSSEELRGLIGFTGPKPTEENATA